MRLLFSFLTCVVISTTVFAQETDCTNGLDDDGDGFIDCYDPDCASHVTCDDIFVGNNGCQIDPPPAPAFTMQLDFSSPNQTTNHLSRVVIGDLDRDGEPEIVTMNKYTRQLFILRGSDGSIKFQQTMTGGATPGWEIATANIDDDDCAEIFFLGTDSRIYVYDCELNFLYNTVTMPGSNDPINFGLADFDNDGFVEIYCKDQIFDAHSGRRLVASTFTGSWGSELNGGPVAVNMDADDDLELVIGLTIYDVTIPLPARPTNGGSLSPIPVNPTPPNPGTLSTRYFIRDPYNATSVADFDQDGTLDVIASGATGCHDKNTTIFFWNRGANTVQTYSDHNSINGDNDYERGWQNGTGRVNIADLDGDGELNLSYVSGGFLYALQEDMTLLWRVAINEETSGYTGCTLFDFNGDGQSEIVYRDEQYLYIINGTDGSVFNSQNCVSRTNREYPIVADLDADGSTEICVTCGFDDVKSLGDFDTIDSARWSHVRVFESAAEPWVPARRVWNQHGYFVVNVNDDLTIPRQQQDHNKLFSTSACRPGDPVVDIRPLNKFLNQSPFLDVRGCPAYSAPDIAFLPNTVDVIPPTCPDLNFLVSFEITNLGDVEFTGDIPISFYTSNPDLPGASWLGTLTFPITNLGTADTFAIVNQPINSSGSDSLWIVLNDDGSTVPTPISLPNTNFIECNYDAPMGIAITPNPVIITALEVSPDSLCSVPPTGSVRAFVLTGAVENTADYDFYWFDGTTVGPIASADFTGPFYGNIGDSTYSVFAIHKTANCSSDTAQVVVNPAPGVLPTVVVTLISDQTDCNPPNGSLQAAVTGGNSGYTFAWEDIAAPIGVSGPLLANQTSGTYTVIVTHSLSGCQTSADGTIGDQTQEPDLVASATGVTDCINLNSGTVTAEAFSGVDPQPDADYIFTWYFYDNVAGTRGSQLPPIHGAVGTPDRTGLPIGFYEVEITEISTGCLGTTTEIVEVTDDRNLPTIEITELAPQTSCDPANPNGRLQAVVSYGGVVQPAADFTFAWFVGQNTIPANAHLSVSGTNGSIAEDVIGGGQSYTVRVTSAFQCVAITDTVVTEILNVPIVTLVSTPNAICNPALASSNFTGSVTATVTFGGVTVNAPFTGYTFEWYNGSVVKPTPDYPLTTLNSISPLDSGYYTLVVTNSTLDCVSLPETEQVTNTAVLPDVTANANPSTNCDPALSNGGVQVTDVDGLGTPATFTYKWYPGSVVVPGDSIATTFASPDTLQGGVGNFFTVLVTNTSDGCQNTATVEVPDASVPPLVTLSPFPNSVCSPATSFNGRVESTITNQGVFPITDYRFTWTDEETNTQVLQAAGAAGQDLLNRDSSYYSVIVRQLSTGCESNQVQAQVTSAKILPDITADANPSTNCDPALSNGGVQVTDVDGLGTPATFTYKWYPGSVVVPGDSIATTFASPDTLQGGVGNFFTVLVTNTIDGCQNTVTVEVPDASVPPLVTLSPFPNSVCSPATSFNGRVESTITNQGVFPITDYRFTWTDEETSTQVLQAAGAAGQDLLNRDSSYYSVIVRQLSTGCESNQIQAQVTSAKILPDITADANPSTNCVPLLPGVIPDGGVQVTDVDGLGTPATFTYKWYPGSVVVPGDSIATTFASPDTLQGGVGNFFTVLVTNTSDGCQNTATVEVPDDHELPEITLSSTDNTICNGTPDGKAFLATLVDRGVNIPSPFAGYTFAWETGATTDTLFNRVLGNYSVQVTNTTTGCASDSANVDVDENFFIPPILITPQNQTSCDTLNRNGELAAVIDETTIGGDPDETAGYDFTWENNGNPFATPGTAAGNTATITSLRGNFFYTVTVERTTTGCINTESIFLPEIINYPIVAAAVSSDVTRCDAPDGRIDALVGGTDVGYTFFWLNEVGSNQTADDTTVVNNATVFFTDNGAYLSLIPGYYTVVARDDNTSCLSQPITRQVQDATVNSLISLLPTAIPSSCGVNGGELTATINGGTGTAFDVTWHTGGPINDSINFFNNPPVFDPVVDTLNLTFNNIPAPAVSALDELYSGIYTVVVRDDGNGCGNYLTVFLPFNNGHDLSTALTPSTLCPYTVGNGRIDVTVNNIVGGNDFQDYTYRLYAGGNPNPAFQIGPVAGPGAGTFNPQPYTSLTPGIYTVEVRQDPAVFTSNCPAYAVVEIVAEAFSPVVDITGTVVNTACNVAAGANGEVAIEITNDANEVSAVAFNYDITVTPAPLGGGAFNTGPYPPNTLPENFTMLGFSPDNVVPEYLIRVENSITNCFTERFVSIPNQPVVPELLSGNVVPTNALACDPLLEATARVEVTDISIVGGGLDNLNFYQFDWFTDIALTTNVYSFQGDATATDGGEVFENGVNAVPAGTVTAGSYWILATKNAVGQPGFGCLTAPFRVIIDDDSVNPTVELAPTPNTACDNNFEGAIQVEVTDPGSVPAATGYTYTWTAVVTAIPTPSASNGDGLLADDNFIQLQDGLYVLQVENNSSGCISNGQTTITESATPIIVATANHVDQIICDPDGSITVVDVLVGGVADPAHGNFDFLWYKDVSTAGTEIVPVVANNDVLDVTDAFTPPMTMGAGTYFVKARRAAGVPFGSGCESAPLRVDVLDASEDPMAQLTPTPNTACDNNFEGAIQVEVTDPGSVPAATGYTYTWTAVITAIPTPSASNGDGLLADDNFIQLEDGLYVLQVENNSSGCTSPAQTTITASATPIIVATANHLDQIICDPDGSITVVDVLVGGIADPAHGNFDFLWYKDVSTAGTEIVPVVAGNDLLDVTDAFTPPMTMGAGTYFVKARRAAGVPFGSGCESAPLRVDVLDASEDPMAQLTPTPNTACDNNFEGAIQVEVTDPGSVPAATGYTYTWTAVITAIPTPSASNGDGLLADDNFIQLEDGLYVLQVENNSSGCTGPAQTTITASATPIIVATANHLDQMICNPDGSITVVDVLVGGTPDPAHGNFDFLWYKDLTTPGTEIVPIAGGNDVLDGTDAFTPPMTIGAGTYFVVARRAVGVPFGSGCESAPLRVDILDLSEDPDLNFAPVRQDSSCNVNTPLGLIQANAFERDASVDNYTFVWTFNGGGFHPATVQTDATPISVLTNAAAGNYSLVVTNTLTGCDFTQGVSIALDTTRSLPNIVNITPTNPVDCFPTGSARVVEITIGGTTTFISPPDDIDTNFDYEWYQGTVPGGLIAGENVSSLLNRLPDRYFARVTDLITSCGSSLVEVIISTDSIQYPVVVIQQTAPQVICNGPVGSGVLVSTADGQDDTNANYTFTWFQSLDLSGPVFANTSTINNLFSGDYSVQAFNSVTNCSSDALFILPSDSLNFEPLLTLASGALTECDTVDGSVFIRGLHFPVTGNPAKDYPFAYSFTADLYVGDPPADINTPEFPNVPNDPSNPLFLENFLQTQLPNDIYTVRLTDNNTGCFTIDTVSVDDDRVYPEPDITEIAPVTNCDHDLRPNGVARALVNGTFLGYSFEWFEGTIPAGAPLYTGSEYGSLKPDPISYVVRATDLITGCSDSTVTQISIGTVAISEPDIEIISNVTSCDPANPNGILTASVDGVTFEYIFDWYNGTPTTPPVEAPPPAFTGELYDSLDARFYGVTALSKITGCKSPMAIRELPFDPDYPDLDFDIQKASCGMNNGGANLKIISDVAIDTVQWYNGFGTVTGNEVRDAIGNIMAGPVLSGVIAGDYSVVVTTILGCETREDVTIDTDIHPFNGISIGDGDTDNSYFHIDCIGDFPQNVVKIYNRAGTLVYEQVGYDNFNLDKRFEGKSNKGVSPMGTNLPDGTYFFIVDKRDGSKSVPGYIEIVK